MPEEFHCQRRVEFAETDMAGMVHFANFFRYMEEAEHEFFRSLGLPVVERRAGRCLSWPRVAASCEFLAPVRFGDLVQVHLRVERTGRSSLTFQISFSKEGKQVARGRMVTACCQEADGQLRAVPIPESVLHKLQGSSREQD